MKNKIYYGFLIFTKTSIFNNSFYLKRNWRINFLQQENDDILVIKKRGIWGVSEGWENSGRKAWIVL